MEKTENPRIELQKLTCLHCGHEWHPRSPQMPAVCPSCKSREWNTKNKAPKKTTIKIRMTADPKLRQALKEARERGVTYQGKLISEDLAFEIGAKCILKTCEA